MGGRRRRLNTVSGNRKKVMKAKEIRSMGETLTRSPRNAERGGGEATGDRCSGVFTAIVFIGRESRAMAMAIVFTLEGGEKITSVQF